MSPDLARRVELVRAALDECPGAWLIAVAGIPGSGKSTLSGALCEAVSGAVALPMDGYHLPRARLGAEGLRRRGAPFTFDVDAFRADLRSLRDERAGSFPAFDHAVKDPEPDAIRVEPGTPLVVVEGLYVLLGDGRVEWLFDLRVFIDCDFDVAMDRIARRHLEASIVESMEASRLRVATSDSFNAELILADGCRERADVVLT